ncbi:ATP-binding protein [Pelotomaculum propionicicum]|uniref:sensor histidine kinase n=1 Tax=Pelotomaculum propionicicum TaxID=258475 RepID=UPI003B7694CF
MNYLNKSILVKLWLVMVALFLVVLYSTGLVQTHKLKDIYYNQQLTQMIKEAQHVAASEELFNNPDPHLLAVLADALDSNIMVTNADLYIEHCIGMGMDLRGVQAEKINVFELHDIPFVERDLQSVMQGNEIFRRGPYHFLNTEVLTVAVPVYENSQIKGSVIFSAPLAPVEERIAELQKITIYAGIVGIVLATFLALLLSRTLSRPLLNMNQAARAMVKGDYSRRVEVRSNDEVGVLAESLNSLATELQKKIETLEQLDRNRRKFVANVSHELRTPLSIIQGYTEALIDGMAGSDADRRKYLGNIHEEILRLRRLVTDILDLRRIEAGGREMEMGLVPLNELAAQVVEKFQPLAGEKKILVSQTYPAIHSTVRGNRDQLEQVLINLLDNAIRYTPDGGKVMVSVKDLGDKMMVSVSDTGPGIPLEEQPQIWERFYKVDKSRARKGGGTGLGLAIVKEIVEAHGGTIDVASKPGEGSTFYFTVPKH